MTRVSVYYYTDWPEDLMARARNPVPAYRLHKPTGQAYVLVPDGAGGRRFVYLGQYNTPESKAAYERILAELRATPAASPGRPATPRGATVNEVLLAFIRHAERHYRRPDGTHTREFGEFKQVCRAVRELYGETTADRFGPLALKALRERFVSAGWCRTLVNRRVNRVRHVFKWAAGEELLPGSVWQNLRAVVGLQANRTDAPETDPVEPVDRADVEAVLPFVRPEVAAMIEVQRLTGMRPGDVCLLRPADIDTTGHVWLYRPAYHKLAYKGKARVVAIGPKAQAILDRFRPADPCDYFFSPRRAVESLHAARSAARVTPLYPSHAKRNQAKRATGKGRPHAERYSGDKYGQAITRGVDRCNADRARHDVPDGAHGPNLPRVPHWHPNQLRHAHGTEVRKRFGLEAAQVALGHARADVTQVYAERDAGLAVKVAAELG